MSEPFLAEIRIVGFNFAPRGWAFCDGQMLPINQNQSLYSLLGTTYGGDGRTSFALPELRGRVPIHVGASNGNSHQLGQKSGEETHTLSTGEMASHNHTMRGVSDTAATGQVTGNYYAASAGGTPIYTAQNPSTLNKSFNNANIPNVGGGQGHNNMQPSLALNFCIALRGLFPSRN